MCIMCVLSIGIASALRLCGTATLAIVWTATIARSMKRWEGWGLSISVAVGCIDLCLTVCLWIYG